MLIQWLEFYRFLERVEELPIMHKEKKSLRPDHHGSYGHVKEMQEMFILYMLGWVHIQLVQYESKIAMRNHAPNQI